MSDGEKSGKMTKGERVRKTRIGCHPGEKYFKEEQVANYVESS